MTPQEWNDPANHVLGMLIRGEATTKPTNAGDECTGDAILLLLNGGARSKPFILPALDGPGIWAELLNTSHPSVRPVREDE